VRLSGNPKPAPRPRVSGRTAYNPTWYENQSAVWALEAGSQIRLEDLRKFFDGERLAVELRFFRADKRRADFDNLAKAATDPLNGVLWRDDAQIDEAHIYVMRGVDSGYATVTVWPRQVSRPQRRHLRQYSPGRHLRTG
jgi:Holliday junction resolvase RusA-like endonuclease